MSPLRVIYSQGTGAVGTTTVTWPKNWTLLASWQTRIFNQTGSSRWFCFLETTIFGSHFPPKLIVARLTSSNQSSSYAWKYPAWLCLKISGNSVPVCSSGLKPHRPYDLMSRTRLYWVPQESTSPSSPSLPCKQCIAVLAPTGTGQGPYRRVRLN